MNDEETFVGERKPRISVIKKWITPKTAIVTVAVLLVVVLGYYYKQWVIAATVNGSPISRLRILRQTEKMAGSDVLERIIVEKLIDAEARKKSVVVTDEEADTAIKKLEDQLVAQGSSLDQALLAEHLTRNDLKKQFTIQAKVEKLLQDKIGVTDEEVAQFIKDNKVTIPKGEDAQLKEQITNQLKQQKLNSEAGAWIESLKAQAKIRYFVSY